MPAAPAPASPSAAAGHVVVAEVVRSGFVEGRHHGSVVALDPSGEVAWAVGDATSPVLPRSCNKPLQAAAMVRAGLALEPELLALASASHSGEPIHVAGVQRILAGAGLTEADLHNPPDLPLDEQERDLWLASGGRATSLHQNCSGKHAAMLATCVAAGWPVSSYLDPGHPLQQHIAGVFAELTGEPVAHVAVDGCGAPLLGCSLTGLARGFRALALADPGTPEGQVAAAIRTHPEFVSGTRRDELALIRSVPGAIAKLGAEGCYVVALPDGRAFALKIDDGAGRARAVVMLAALERAGVLEEAGVDAGAVRRTARHVLTGGGEPVGEVRAVLQ